jgi:uncharacterized protein (TIGR02246 family)
MKNLLVLCALFCVFALQAQSRALAQEGGCAAADREAIVGIVDAWKDGYNGGDAAKVAALYEEDAYYLTQHFVTGVIHGRPMIQAYVQRGVDAHYKIDSIRVLSLNCSGSFAYAITRYDSTNAGQKAFGVNLVVLEKRAGRWRIAAHEAAVPDPATAVQSLEVPGR